MPGALVISLDFELHWGVRERPLDGPYRANLLGEAASVRETLALFREFGVSATWAAVGFLLARSRDELRRFSPAVRPRYRNPVLDPYGQAVGEGEHDDPFHYAPTLIREIVAAPGQELATHTFSHFYCLEPADGAREAFRADLASAQAITRELYGVEPRSIVFPRNQHNPAFDDVLLERGITCYRGNPPAWMWRPRDGRRETPLVRGMRLLDAYLPVGRSYAFRREEVPQPNGTFNVPASFLLRRNASILETCRIARAIRAAASRGEVVHLWWHPHNFGVRTRENMRVLRTLLQTFDDCRTRHGMESLSMQELAANCV